VGGHSYTGEAVRMNRNNITQRVTRICIIAIFFSIYKANKLWKTLNGLAINTRLIEAIKALYEGSSNKIKIGNLITKGFKVTKGLRHGCSLSPT
jgi:hypothetical protein